MEWNKLICDCRFGLEHHHSAPHNRTDFQRDFDRLVFSAPFRRLQNKTQVFPLPGKVFVHNRLTHSLEVSCIGRSLGNQVGERVVANRPQSTFRSTDVGAIVSAACLAHDMGNPPFGHSGERAIMAYFKEGKGKQWKAQVESEGGRWTDFTKYEGNANAFRLLTHAFRGRREGGFVLTYSTLAAIVKYPYTSLDPDGKKLGFFAPEEEAYQTIANRLGIPRLSAPGEPLRYARHPLVYLVEAADDICYQIMDIEDAFKLNFVSRQEVLDLFLAFFPQAEHPRLLKHFERVSDVNEQIAYLRSAVIGTLIDACTEVFMNAEEQILEGAFPSSLVEAFTAKDQTEHYLRLGEAYKACQKIATERIYCAKEVVDIEFAGFRIFEFLLDSLIEAQLHPGYAYSKLWERRIPSQYDLSSNNMYGRIMTALDYISSMTDVYALDLYRKITGMNLPAI